MIFDVLSQTLNLGFVLQDAENRRAIDFFDVWHPGLVRQKFKQVHNCAAPKNGGQTLKNAHISVKTVTRTKPILSVYFSSANLSVRLFFGYLHAKCYCMLDWYTCIPSRLQILTDKFGPKRFWSWNLWTRTFDLAKTQFLHTSRFCLCIFFILYFYLMLLHISYMHVFY